MPDSLALAHRALPVLSNVQNASALAFSSFALLHVASPFLSAFGPAPTGWNRSPAETAATAWQMLARVWYRDSPAMEATVVWGSLGVHVASGAARRWLREWERNERRARRVASAVVAAEESVEAEDQAHEDRPRAEGRACRKLKPLAPLAINLHQAAGFVLIPFLAHHVWSHRLLPFTLTPPLSSSLITYQLPSYLLSSASARSPLLPWISYGALALLGTYHAVIGLRVIWKPLGPRKLGPGEGGEGEGWAGAAGRWVWSVAAAVGVVGVMVGLTRMSSEGKHIPEFIARRYADVAKRGFPL